MIDARKEPLAARVAAVGLCNDLWGKVAARALWKALALPDAQPTPAARVSPARAAAVRLEEFIAECIEPAEQHIWFTELRTAHREWCQKRGVTPSTDCALAVALSRRGFTKDKIAGRMAYGARLTQLGSRL